MMRKFIPRPGGKFGVPMWQFIMAHLRDAPISRICRDLGIGFHINLFKEFEKRKWIELVKKGGAFKIHFTDEGRRVQETCQKIYSYSMNKEGTFINERLKL